MTPAGWRAYGWTLLAVALVGALGFADVLGAVSAVLAAAALVAFVVLLALALRHALLAPGVRSPLWPAALLVLSLVAVPLYWWTELHPGPTGDDGGRPPDPSRTDAPRTPTPAAEPPRTRLGGRR